MAADNREFVNKFANEGGGDIYAEDKRFEELKSATAKTGSQISTSAQYIPLQDTDGNLVKINPQSFQEAVRNVLGSLLANNDKGTTISGIPALSGSGANLDFGSISPANLASVLGVLVNNKMNNGQAFTTDYDANQCTSTGYYPIGTSGFVPYEDIHLPSGSNVIIVTLNFIAYYILQLGVEQQGKLFWREQTDRTNWTAWKEL